MAFQREVLGLKDLDANLKRIAKLVPGGQVADSLADGVYMVVLKAQQNAHAHGLADTYALIQSIRVKKINQYRVDIEAGSDEVPYAAAHEFGVTVTITEKQRRFFWAMYIETKDEKWKWMALAEKYTIIEKPYLRPAVDTEKRRAAEHAAMSLAGKIAEVVR